MTQPYKQGQVVRGIKGAGTRTVTKTSPTKVWWKSGKRVGVCLIHSFKSWQKGNNKVANR